MYSFDNSMTANDFLVNESNSLFCCRRRHCFCFWPASKVVYSGYNISVTIWGDFKRSNEVNSYSFPGSGWFHRGYGIIFCWLGMHLALVTGRNVLLNFLVHLRPIVVQAKLFEHFSFT